MAYYLVTITGGERIIDVEERPLLLSERQLATGEWSLEPAEFTYTPRGRNLIGHVLEAKIAQGCRARGTAIFADHGIRDPEGKEAVVARELLWDGHLWS